jgi:hypothetical protein
MKRKLRVILATASALGLALAGEALLSGTAQAQGYIVNPGNVLCHPVRTPFVMEAVMNVEAACWVNTAPGKQDINHPAGNGDSIQPPPYSYDRPGPNAEYADIFNENPTRYLTGWAQDYGPDGWAPGVEYCYEPYTEYSGANYGITGETPPYQEVLDQTGANFDPCPSEKYDIWVHKEPKFWYVDGTEYDSDIGGPQQCQTSTAIQNTKRYAVLNVCPSWSSTGGYHVVGQTYDNSWYTLQVIANASPYVLWICSAETNCGNQSDSETIACVQPWTVINQIDPGIASAGDYVRTGTISSCT